MSLSNGRNQPKGTSHTLYGNTRSLTRKWQHKILYGENFVGGMYQPMGARFQIVRTFFVK
jgi:hypothetical protein